MCLRILLNVLRLCVCLPLAQKFQFTTNVNGANSTKQLLTAVYLLNQKYFKNNCFFICGCKYFDYSYKEFKNYNYEKSFFFIGC